MAKDYTFLYCRIHELVHEQGPQSKNTNNLVVAKDHKTMAKGHNVAAQEHMTKYFATFFLS